MRHFSLISIPIILILITACVNKQPEPKVVLSQEQLNAIKRVYVVASSYPAKIESTFFASGKGAAVAKGMGKGLIDTAGGMKGGGGGIGEIIVFILIAPFVMTGESIYYAVDTPGSVEQEKITHDVKVSAESMRLQELFADEVTASGNRLTKMKFERLNEADNNISETESSDGSIVIMYVKIDKLSYDDDKEIFRMSAQSRVSIPGEENLSVERKLSSYFTINDIRPYLEENATRLKEIIWSEFQKMADEAVSSTFQ